MLLSHLQRIAKLDAGGIAFQRKFNISEKSNVIQAQETHWGKSYINAGYVISLLSMNSDYFICYSYNLKG